MRVAELSIGIGLASTLLGAPAVAQSCAGDAFEQDDGCVVSRTMLPGGANQSHDFCDDASDWLAFNACGGRGYTIATSMLGTSADTVVDLYAGDCSSLLASDDDGGGGKSSRIVWTAPSDGTYHVRVRQKDGTTGTNRGYQIALTGDTSSCGTWARWYQEVNGGLIQVESGIVSPDGGGIVGGYVDDGLGQLRTSIVRAGPDGAVEWARRVDGASLTFFQAIAATDDGGCFFLDRPQTSGAWVAKLDAAGAFTWQKTYGGGSGTDEAVQVVATADGGFALAGRTDEFGSGNTMQPWVMKADASGNVQWSIRLGFDDDRATAILALRDGGFLAAGDRFDTTKNAYQVWAARLDAAGAIVWQKSYGGALDDAAPGGVLENGDGSLVISATTTSFSPDAGSAAVWLLGLDSGGALQWQHRYWTSPGSIPVLSGPALARAAGGQLLAGKSLDIGAPQRSLIFMTDATGTPLWQQIRRPTEAGATSLRGLSPVPDGGALLFEDSPEESGIRRIDAAGTVSSCSVVGAAPGFSDATTTATATTTAAARRSYGVSVTATTFTLTPLVVSDHVRCPCSTPGEAQIVMVEKRVIQNDTHWMTGPPGLAFDMVKGDLGVLRATAGDFTSALNAVPPLEVCWLDDFLTNDVSETSVPEPGTGFFLIARPVAACHDEGSYDGSDGRQVGSRDAEIEAAASTCP